MRPSWEFTVPAGGADSDEVRGSAAVRVISAGRFGPEPTYPTLMGGTRDFERCATASDRVTSRVCAASDAGGACRDGGRSLRTRGPRLCV